MSSDTLRRGPPEPACGPAIGTCVCDEAPVEEENLDNILEKPMTPKELLELADSEASELDHNPRVVAALRSYAELCASLQYIEEHYVGTLEIREVSVLPADWVKMARDLGWPGLEEL